MSHIIAAAPDRVAKLVGLDRFSASSGSSGRVQRVEL